MGEQYEYQRFNLDPNTGLGAWSRVRKKGVQHYLQPLGDEGWEVVWIGGHTWAVGQGIPGSCATWVEARKRCDGAQIPNSWEYTGINVWGMPNPDWDHHIASRGWKRVQEAWFDYYFQEWFVYKRPDKWRGTDDGDILGQLEIAGAQLSNTSVSLSWQPGGWQSAIHDTVKQILQIKWELSEQAGNDVGTHAALQHWLAKTRQ